MVFQIADYLSGTVMLDWRTSGAVGWFYQLGTEPIVRVRADSTGPEIPGCTVGNFHLIELFCSGSSSTAIVDQGTPVTGTVGTAAMEIFTVGSTDLLASESEIDVSEIVVASAEVTGSNLTNLRQYFTDKYDL